MDTNIIATIGIPFYNAERFLDIAIQSVLNQTFSNFELILSNDGSTDRSLDIAKSYNDSRITILTDGINKGISQRLNDQISIAKGKYFVRMDADDIMFPNRLNKQILYLQENPEIDVIGSYAIVIDDDNNLIGLRSTSIPNSIISCFRSVPFIHPTITGRIEWFKKYQYSNGLKGVEDLDLWIRSYNKSKYFIIPEPQMFYRDPLKIKFDEYKFRIFQLQKMYKSNKMFINNSIYILLYFKFIDYCKLITYYAFNSIRIDKYLLKKRNRSLNAEMHFQALSIMNSILTNNTH